MAYLNYVALIGNLTRDPEVRYTAGGTPICDFSIAMSRKSKSATGEERTEVCYLDVTRLGKGADGLARYLAKGVPVLVNGSLKFDSWKDKTGKNQSRITVMADRVQILGHAPKADRQQEEPEHRYTAADKNPHGVQDDIPF